ncbi:MAG: alanine racemase [Eubacteriales bacterium]|nr:alanine racemase [Eubacteriales bacterium]
MDSTLKRTWAEIDLDALAHNYKTLKERIGKDVKFLGVVKADAYGHGSVRVSRLLQSLGADYLAVSSIDEAVELRLNNITMPILILGHTPREQVANLIKYNITQAVTCKAKAIEYSEEAVKCHGILKIHIKVDTGMSRLGYLCDGDYFNTGVEGICEGCSLPGLDAEGIFTHFAVSDEPGDECKAYTEHQFKLFTDVINAVEEKLGQKFLIRHCANTGAVAKYKDTWLDMVRPGLLLYGYGEFAGELGLKPVMSLMSTVSTIKIYPAGTAISYGGIFKTDRKTRIGVLPYGYADGFFRCLSNRCEIMTKAGPAKQRGKICMDMCMIDLTDMPSVDVGSEVEIFGKNNSINDLAALAGTIPYELTCAVSKRVPRIYIRDGEVVEKELLLRNGESAGR